MATAYQLQIAHDYVETIRLMVTKLDEMPLQDLWGEHLQTLEQEADTLKCVLEDAEPEGE